MASSVSGYLCGLVLICAASCQNSDWVEEANCPANNRSSDLEILPPVNSSFQTLVHTYSDRHFVLYCCATGYSYFKWYKDGVELGPSTSGKFQYNHEDTRESIFLFQLQGTDCSNTSFENFYVCTFTCTAFSEGSIETESLNISVIVYQRVLAGEPGSVPEFLNASAEQCLHEGQTMHAFCYLQYDSEENLFEKDIEIRMEDGTSLSDLMNKSLPMESRRIQEAIIDPIFDKIGYLITIYNVSEEFLNQTYTCHSITHPTVTRSFHVAKCGQEMNITTDVKSESSLSLHIGIPLAVLVLLLVILTVLLVKFNVYANLWYKTHLMQRADDTTADYTYDVYVIYRDLAHPVVAHSIELLENELKLRLCLAERDFPIGAVAPESITECLKSSKTVVAFLSNDMFVDGNSVQDWSDVSLSLSLRLNKRMIFFLLEEIDNNRLRKRKDIKAALKLLKCVRCPTGSGEDLNVPFLKYQQMFSVEENPEKIV